jgi:hypothetical protein
MSDLNLATALNETIKKNHEELIEEFVKGDLTKKQEMFKEGKITTQSINDTYEYRIVGFLYEENALFNAVDKPEKHDEIKWLLENGAKEKINEIFTDGQKKITPLFKAVTAVDLTKSYHSPIENTEIIKLLLENGAKTDVKNITGTGEKTILEYLENEYLSIQKPVWKTHIDLLKKHLSNDYPSNTSLSSLDNKLTDLPSQSSNNSSTVTSTNDPLTDSLQKTLQTALTSSNSTDASSKFYMFRIFNSESGDWISFPGFVVETGKLVLKKSFEKTRNILGSNSYVEGNGADLAQSIEIGEANKFNFDKTMSEIIQTPKKEDKYDFNTKDNSQKELEELKELKEKLADPKWYPVFTVFEEKEKKKEDKEKKEESKEKEEKKNVIEIKGRLFEISDKISANDNCKSIMDIISNAPDVKPDVKPVDSSDVKTVDSSDVKTVDSSDASVVKPVASVPVVKNESNIDATNNKYIIDENVLIGNSINNQKVKAKIISVPHGNQVNYQVEYTNGTTEYVLEKYISKPEVNAEDNKYKANDNVWVKQTDKNNYKKATVISIPNNTQLNYKVKYADQKTEDVSQDAMVKLKQNEDKKKVPINEIVYIGNSNNTDKTKATIVSEFNNKNKSYSVKHEDGSEEPMRPEYIFIEDLQSTNADSIDKSLLTALNNTIITTNPEKLQLINADSIDKSLLTALNNTIITTNPEKLQLINADSIDKSLLTALNNAFKPESQSNNADSIETNLTTALNNTFKPEAESIGITKVLNDALESKKGGKRDPDRERVYKLPIYKRKTDNYYNYE